MNNPQYNAETTHLPNADDKRKWRESGRKKHEREKLRVSDTIRRMDSLHGIITVGWK